ncbi:MAG: hypothetical protein GX675_01370 [Erysipelotrichaceae bacterium]|nr:hypothetical protein [Erysipelotrichaceae bacterium]
MNNKHIGKHIKKLSISIEKYINNTLQKYELTSSQGMVLSFIQKSNGELNPVDIEKNFKYSHPTVLGILKRLQEKEFIDINKSKKDQRFNIISLTEKGKSVKNEIQISINELEERLLKDIDENSSEIFMNTLFKMIDNLKEIDDDKNNC